MGDRLATLDMDRKEGVSVPLSGEQCPHLTQCPWVEGRGLPPFQVAS